jgi:hypothetical protein
VLDVTCTADAAITARRRDITVVHVLLPALGREKIVEGAELRAQLRCARRSPFRAMRSSLRLGRGRRRARDDNLDDGHLSRVIELGFDALQLGDRLLKRWGVTRCPKMRHCTR